MKKEITIDDKKDIKKQRIKMYFLEATKEVIIKEGVENVTARKVADIAGYSYATIYNYFEDINGMLIEARSLIIKDIVEYMFKKINEPLYNAEGIKRLFRTYISYYFENPNVFKFFYFHQLRKSSNQTEVAEGPNFEVMWEETFRGFVMDGTLQPEDIEVISKIFIYAIHGMIAISFSYDGELTEDKVYKDLDQMIDYLL